MVDNHSLLAGSTFGADSQSDGSEPPQWENAIVASVAQAVAAIPYAVSLLIGAGGAAYILGWVTARAYCSRFAAEWLLTEMSSTSIVSFSSSLLFVAVGVLGTSVINLGARVRRSQAMLIARPPALVCLFGLLLAAAGVADSGGNQRWASILSFVSEYGLLGLAVAIFNGLVVRHRIEQLAVDLSIIRVGSLAIFCLFVATVTHARAAGARDVDANQSLLPRVGAAGHTEGDLRLLTVSAGRFYDWAAKGTRLLVVRAVIARGFERIHRSNLIGMGVFPCQLPEGVSAQTLGLDGTERFDLELGAPLRPRQPANLHIKRRDGRRESVPLVLRIDTPIEAAYFSAGGILPYVLEQLLTHA